MRLARASAAVAAAATLLALGVFAYANVSLRPLEAGALDAAIRRGLDYLDRADRFASGPEAGGHAVLELWLAKRILDHEDHPGFRADVERGWEAAAEGASALLTGLPGEPRRPLGNAERNALRFLLDRHWRLGNQGHPIWARWMIYALHPELADALPGERERFLGEGWAVSNGYMLTHRLVSYQVLRALHPETAEAMGIPELERRARRRLYAEALLDFRICDLYFERLAFLQRSPGGAPVRRRWIERVLADQNADGGWAFVASVPCELRRLVGRCDRGESSSHASFLAVYALVQYRAHERAGEP